MKNKIYLGIFAIALSMLATPGQAQEGCAPSTTLTLVVSKYHLNLIDKAPVCVTESNPVFTIKIVGAFPTDMGNVTAREKGPDPGAISSLYNANAKELTVGVQIGDIADPTEFDYLIKVDGVGEIDPKIRVIPD